MRSKKALLNLLSNILLQIVIVASGFIVPKIIIQSFGSETNGLVSSITHFLAYITLLESGFGPVIRSALYKPILNKDKETISRILKTTEKYFRRIAVIFLAYIILLSIVYPLLVEREFSWVFTSSLVVIIGISTFAEYYFGMTYSIFLHAKQKKYVISIIQIITYILSTAAIIILAKCGASIHVIKLASGLLFLLRPLLQSIYVKKKYKLCLEQYDGNYKIEKKWDGLAQHVAHVIHTKTDVVVLTIFATLSEVSIYSVYSLVCKGLRSFIQALTSGIDATFGEMIARNEDDSLREKFSMYETMLGTFTTIFFSTATVLATPFVMVYTKGITDANYIHPIFGILLVTSEYIWAIRQPYNVVVQAAGHFRETRIGAWVECILNIAISIILVNQLGIVGVAIGTIVAMSVRTLEFICYANKHILKQSAWCSFRKIILIVVETILIVFLAQLLPFKENNSYTNWGINAIMVACVAAAITFSINGVLFHRELLESIKLIRRSAKRKK